MKRLGLDLLSSVSRRRSIKILIVLGVLYVILVSLEVPFVFRNGLSSVSTENSFGGGNSAALVNSDNHFLLEIEENLDKIDAPFRPIDNPLQSAAKTVKSPNRTPLSNLNFTATIGNLNFGSGISKSANEAIELGRKLWQDLESISKNQTDKGISVLSSSGPSVKSRNSDKKPEKCPHSISVTGHEFSRNGRILLLPCGLTLGSHVTIVGKPRVAHAETDTKISLLQEGQYVMVSQFMMELQGLKTVEGEDPPRIFHFNPRLKGDWSGKPVIEMNTCYRMQWGMPQRCEGWKSQADEETVDDLVKCEKWIRDDDNGSEKSKATWWVNRLIGRTKQVSVDWPFPFSEGKLFVLTLSAGLEGYHINIDGRHITSFPYRTGFALEDATGLFLNGDVDIHSIIAASLPTAHPSFAPQRHLDLSEKWKAPLISDKQVELFIGILSAGNHFAERMAARKSWMQHRLIKSSDVVARFFVALHPRKEVNIEVKREAEFFGDIVIVPYMDNYDLVVLKTVAICEFGVRSVSAKYIMKGDDDTFVRVDAVINEAEDVTGNKSVYIGNINYYHKPLRSGKWAVTFEEWPEEVYPPYANGPGYIISHDIASYILSDFEKHKLRLFKMEDVSVGMWVEKFNGSRAVEYVHSLKFCQFGCIEGYVTAHYQSPRQMICLWNKLRQLGRASCCNMR